MAELAGVTNEPVQGQESLEPLLHASMVGWEDLNGSYHSLLELVRALLGVVPNCDRYLEIWPPAFRSYNVMVPNLLNLPVPLLGFGGPPPSVVGLAMYVASRTAASPYCSAHSCSFALRRGADPEKVATALLPERSSFESGELAAIAVARSLAAVPGQLRATDKAAMIDAYGEKRAEWIALSVVMMGFLNKFMDTVGVDVEQPVVSEVFDTLGDGWTPGKAGARLDPDAPLLPPPPIDSLRSRLRILPLIPAAIRYDRRAQQGTPLRGSAVTRHLTVTTGHDFPVLAALRSSRARRAIATMLKDNLDPATSLIGIRTKVLVGAVYAAVVADPLLMADVEVLAERAGLPAETLAAAAAFGRLEAPAPEAATALQLAREASSSPAAIGTATVSACAQDLSPEAIIEVVTWLSVLQLLHRLHNYVRPTG